MNYSGGQTPSSNGRHAVIVGSGPNGLTAAAVLALSGWQVDVYEAGATPGGAARSESVLGEGTISDLGAAAHPFGAASPAFHYLGLEDHGLEWAYSPYPMAHPLDNGRAGILSSTLNDTADRLGADGGHWKKIHRNVVKHIDQHLDNVLGSVLKFPKHPVKMAQFGVTAMLPAQNLANAAFASEEARALFIGSAVHSATPPTKLMTASLGLLFGALGHTRGWPVVVGGTKSIIDALLNVLNTHGGNVHCGHPIESLEPFRNADAIILNQTPKQILKMPGARIHNSSRLAKWKYGPSSYKIDYLLDGPIPWTNPDVANATTVHVCGTADEIAFAEAEVAAGKMPERPFVIVCQQQLADPSRAREGRHVVWAYAHVPRGFVDKRASALITAQIDRFAPGFRDRILSMAEHNAHNLEAWNPNLVGGDITAGTAALRRIQPRLGPGLYMASASNAPGGGVHGMPGWWAAQAVLNDHH
ncbi:hypothetical protein CDES_02595 [Corynebacterium deserti GIMN1.010]|uniref:Uncharacterized protein n=1 Tax=Corynebacterium deserti GIMN1.010 TaxID=931089 RepID=A0A0M5IQS0_9CORY|nr:NAD(P)/FAD-dependent oxidoreductase [Corynebacterium deserti]ALC04974.1 hypothetical protein CDES_02595 [Corynebacterium deserti GIMN1.010]